MAIQAAELQVVINADTQSAERGLKEVDSGVTGLAGDMKKLIGMEAMRVLADFGTQVRSVASDFISSAAEAQEVQAQLNAVLESTKGVAGVTAEAANELADSLSQVTKFDDEAILSAESLMLTFTKISSKVFPRAVEAALDMSTAVGQDLKSSVIQLGKALNDPIEGVSALRRVGVMFTDEQEEMIKQLVKSGKILDAQKIILDELSTEFGGAARAAGQTFGGQLAILSTRLGNVKEELGAAFIPVLTELLTAIQPLIPAIQQAAQWFAALPQPVLTTIAALGGIIAVVLPIAASLGSVITAISGVIPLLSSLGSVATTVSGVIAAAASGPLLPILAVIAAITALYLAWKNNWFGIRNISTQIWSQISAAFQQFTGGLRSLWETNWGGIRSYFTMVWSVITASWNAIKALFSGDWQGFLSYVQQAWETAWNYVKEVFSNIWSAMTSVLMSYAGNIISRVVELVDKIKAAFRMDWASIGSDIIQGIVNGLRNGISQVMDMARQIAQSALATIKKTLGIRSPSKEFERIAQMSIAGLVKGLQVRRPIEIAMEGVSASLLAPVSNQNWNSTQAQPTQIYNNYYLTVNSQRSLENIQRDFDLMRRWR